MIELVSAFGLGLLSGVITGLAPGIPIIVGYLLFLPMVAVDPAALIVYAVVSNLGSQYFGSQAALYYRIPGESSSYPVLMEAHNITAARDIYQAVQVTTWGSLVSTTMAAIAMYLVMTTSVAQGLYLPVTVKAGLFAVMVAISIFLGQYWMRNLLAVIFCAALAFYEDLAGMTQGIMPVYYFNSLLALIIVFSLQAVWKRPEKITTEFDYEPDKFHWRPWIRSYFKYGAVGLILGWIPQMGSTISSYASYAWSKYRGASTMQRIAASETANNAAIVSSWMPLLIFGVPITATEVFLLQYFTQKGLDFSVLREKHLISVLVGAILTASLVYVALALSTNRILYQQLARLLSSRWFGIVLVSISVSMFYYINDYTMTFVLVHMAVFVPLSWVVSRLEIDMFPVVLGMLLMGEILSTWYRVVQIYF